MFQSFFPKPKLFFLSFALWALACMALWFAAAQDWGAFLGLGPLLGLPQDWAQDVWFYQYTFAAYALFCGTWFFAAPHPWRRWSVLGSALILFGIWYQVEVDVMINEWFGRFYDLIQRALEQRGSVQPADYYREILTFANIAVIGITVAVILLFFISHYVFRWRTAMNQRYVAIWPRIRHIEGASQRIQEDTMRFADITESLGVEALKSLMTLIAFLPILWGLSKQVPELPLLGAVPHSLVFVALLWSIFGTVILAAVGVRLPGLYFINQRAEAAYRKELVLGEDHAERAQPLTLRELFAQVRRNYFNLYFHYLYFNVARYAYLQTSAIVAYAALGPTIIAGAVSFGLIQQTVRAFGQVQDSFQFLVYSWSTIVELMSIHKRLAAFEASIADLPLPRVDRDYLAESAAEG